MESVNGYLVLRELSEEEQDKNALLLTADKKKQPIRKFEVVVEGGEDYPIGTQVLINSEDAYSWNDHKIIKKDEVLAKWAK